MEKPFRFFSLGSMAFLGESKGIYDGSSAGEPRTASKSSNQQNLSPPGVRGILAVLLWRFAYWGRQTSIVNKILIPVHWAKAYVFGRDISRY